MNDPIKLAEKIVRGEPLKEFVVPKEAQELDNSVEDVNRDQGPVPGVEGP
jgi:hypothetical protein